MNVREVDERTSRWEVDTSAYRVYIFRGPVSGLSWSTATFDITDADFLTVARWAQSTAAPDGLYAIALVSTNADGELGITWLLGNDANRQDAPSSNWFREMQARRGLQSFP